MFKEFTEVNYEQLTYNARIQKSFIYRMHLQLEKYNLSIDEVAKEAKQQNSSCKCEKRERCSMLDGIVKANHSTTALT